MEPIVNFKINACNPKNTATFDNEDTKISEAIYTIFPMDTEDAILSWGDENISLSYRYDIGTIIDEVIDMIFTVQNKNAERWENVWSSNTFAGEWHFNWIGDSLEIEAHWRDEFGASDYLKCHNVLRIEKDRFLIEWGKIIKILIVNLRECGYDLDNLSDMSLLIEVDKILN